MFYIHSTACISPQRSLLPFDVSNITEAVENKLMAIEPAYDGIPPTILRRMGKAVRIGVGAALQVLNTVPQNDGIIIGTASGGLEDCIKFLNQVIEYEEGTLTPTNFVQSTANAIASQLALLSCNKGYNITHVHQGLAFENAAIDVAMLLKENPEHQYLLGGIEEISSYNYHINYLDGWYKKESISNKNLYAANSPGSIAGEGAAAFSVNGSQKNAVAHLKAVLTLNEESETTVRERFEAFLHENLKEKEALNLLLSGENGDNRLIKHYLNIETAIGKNIPIARFKHLTGEFETVTALAVHMACQILQDQTLPDHLLKNKSLPQNIDNILIYNTTKSCQHSFLLLSKI